MSKSTKIDSPYLLRGYVRRLIGGKWLGVCLTLNLVVEADSREGAKDKLEQLIDAYVNDAIENDEVDAFIPRRAPVSFYVEYFLLRLSHQFKSRPSSAPSLVFSENRQLKHA